PRAGHDLCKAQSEAHPSTIPPGPQQNHFIKRETAAFIPGHRGVLRWTPVKEPSCLQPPSQVNAQQHQTRVSHPR
ncbi:hypothetical protein DSO57_1033553, partial [Entomophthora muscae]